MKTETEGLSREEFEKLREDFVERWVDVDKRSIARAGFHAGYAAASSLKQAPQEYEIMDTSSMKREPAEGKQADPPSQPELCQRCKLPESAACHHLLVPGIYTKHCFVRLVAESPSQASTQPKCNCGAGDDAYLVCHADVCALKKWAAPRYEISQATKEEWARRIAEESAKDQDSFGGVFMSVERVLAILK